MYKRTIACLITVALGFTVGWSQPTVTPQNLNIAQPGGTLAQSQLDLRWEPVKGALGYEVLRKVNGRWWLNEDDPNCTPMTNSTSITGLAAGSDFEFCVRAVLTTGVSPNGLLATGHTLAAGTMTAVKPQMALNLPDVPDPEAENARTRRNTDPDPVPKSSSITDLLPPPPPRVKNPTATPPSATALHNSNTDPDPMPAHGSITDLVPPPPKAKPVTKEEPKGPPPPTPEGLMGMYTSQSDVRLSWRPVREATGYLVEEEKEGKWVLLDDGIVDENRPSFVLKNRGAGPYFFRVRAVRYGVRSSYSLPTKIER